MNKFILKALLIILLGVFPNLVYARGNIVVSPANLNITKGENATFVITADNSAGRVDLSSSDTSIASISTSTLFIDMESIKVTVTGNKIGTTAIKIYVTDATTFDDEDLSGKVYTVNVNVMEPSNNNNLKSLTIEGYDLSKIDNNNYKLSVNNGITDITLAAIAEDNKATVLGNGIHKLVVGENLIEIIITSESGIRNKINILVTRKDGYYIEDLDYLLNNSDLDEVDIIIGKDTVISEEDLIKIHNSRKLVRFNYYDDNKNLIYSWVVDGPKLKNIQDVLTSISNDSNFDKEISQLTNSIEGLHVNFAHDNKLPQGIRLKIYLYDKFTDGKQLSAYRYNEEIKMLELVYEKLVVKGGYVEFDVSSSTDVFVTVSDMNIVTKSETSYKNIIIFSVMGLLLLCICVVIIRLRKEKNDEKTAIDSYS